MTTPSLTYTNMPHVHTVARDTAAPRYGHTVSGYGSSIPTAYRIRYRGQDGLLRWHGVYVMIYSNAGTAYIRSRGKRLILDTFTEHRLQAL